MSFFDIPLCKNWTTIAVEYKEDLDKFGVKIGDEEVELMDDDDEKKQMQIKYLEDNKQKTMSVRIQFGDNGMHYFQLKEQESTGKFQFLRYQQLEFCHHFKSWRYYIGKHLRCCIFVPSTKQIFYEGVKLELATDEQSVFKFEADGRHFELTTTNEQGDHRYKLRMNGSTIAPFKGRYGPI